ncbi:GNAT family N-acetyltransferase [Phycicoccus sp. Root101]|uniref:GNAT family N-acetyltransferase n=1 Tax=Phycicoccus sp. Root101 TaxID=1736421 RepID=UPI0007038551|nr:GNAT family protein [Phycicoccus sp. Root101]KQU65438.1 GCN5 family acetyltransferase [Phycicoccus sp. Root101]
MLQDHWPLYALTTRTTVAGGDAVVELRLPREEEVAELADLAGRGVHRPGERPFLTPWTEGSAGERADAVLRGHWERLASWTPQSWRLGMAVLLDGRPVGMVTLRADDFRVVRDVSTSSWLGLAHQGRGVGTAARASLLAVAFDHLGAESALTEVFRDNHASQGVSRRLGYEPDGISRDARGDEVLVSDRLRLTRTRWSARSRPVVEVTGMDGCRGMFGV